MSICALLRALNGSESNGSELQSFSNGSLRPPSILFLKQLSYAYISPTIISFGIFGDLMTIFILSHPLLRRGSVIYMYLTCLAITDLCTQLSVLPMILWLLDIKFCSSQAAVYYAHVGFPLANAFMGASVWIVVFLTLSQYVAICHPFNGTFKSRKMSLYLTGVAYFVSFCIYLPWGWKKAVFKVPWSTDCPYIACDNASIVSANWFWIYQWVREAISRFIPFILVAYFNIRIIIVYRRTKRDRMARISESQKQTIGEKSEAEERRLWLLLVSIISLFFFCTIPAAPLTILVSDRWAKNFTFQVVRAITNILEFTKFALNFYFYCMINPDIRRLCVQKLLCQELVRPAMVGSKNATLLTNVRSLKSRNTTRSSRNNQRSSTVSRHAARSSATFKTETETLVLNSNSKRNGSCVIKYIEEEFMEGDTML